MYAPCRPDSLPTTGIRPERAHFCTVLTGLPRISAASTTEHKSVSTSVLFTFVRLAHLCSCAQHCVDCWRSCTSCVRLTSMTNPHAQGVIPPITLKTRLMLARDYRGLTQAQLAALIEVGIRSIIRFERGDAVPKRGQMMAWAMATGVSYEWLETGNPPAPEDGGGVSEPSSIPRLR